jgi:hypothetical protein
MANGSARIITLTNIGTITATAVAYAASPALPAGTTVTPANCGDLAPGASCSLTVTPGATPSALPGVTAPAAVSLAVSGSNTNTLLLAVNVVTFGSVYQSGYVFALDDTTPNTGSVGGKVAGLQDQSSGPGVRWSNPFSDDIPGIYENSTTSLAGCNGNTDGGCNTPVIRAFYSGNALTTYAAGLCSTTIDGYSDWYLPAICELGYDDSNAAGSGCGSSGSPTVQNIQSNLVDALIPGAPADNVTYWSSTELSSSPATFAWVHSFHAGGGSFQASMNKAVSLSARCARSITN